MYVCCAKYLFPWKHGNEIGKVRRSFFCTISYKCISAIQKMVQLNQFVEENNLDPCCLINLIGTRKLFVIKIVQYF